MRPSTVSMREEFFNAIMRSTFDKCKSHFYFLPMYDIWEIFFSIDYKYLHPNFKTVMDPIKILSKDLFIDETRRIHAEIQKEFDFYFHAIWC